MAITLLLACQCSPKQITYCREGKDPLKYSGNERIKKSTCIFLIHYRNNFTMCLLIMIVCLFPFLTSKTCPLQKINHAWLVDIKIEMSDFPVHNCISCAWLHSGTKQYVANTFLPWFNNTNNHLWKRQCCWDQEILLPW